ncbi:hypothetical protein JHK82_021398 [Glycine max]|nr:hypothetical protein JHK82_021398 [Glycine max]
MITGFRCSGSAAGWCAVGGSGGLRILWESLLTLRGGGRVPWSWSSFFPGGDDVPQLPEGNSGGFMVGLGDRKRKWVLL